MKDVNYKVNTMEKVRTKKELYMDFIQYMEKEHNVQFNWEPTRFFSQKLEHLTDDSYLSDIKSNHYEPDCNLSSNLYLYFEKHMTDSEKAQFENYNDFKEKFFF